MTLVSLDLPENPEKLAEWVEEFICSEDLLQAAIIWETLASEEARGMPLRFVDLTEDQLVDIGQHGLKSLSESQLRKLMASPEALVDLQEYVMIQAPLYWQQRSASRQETPLHDARWSQIRHELNRRSEKPDKERPSRSGQATVWSGLAALIAVAASIAVGVWVNLTPPAPQGWGFNKPGVLESSRSETELLENLAAAAHSWFNKRPQNREELITRLKQFDAGCQKLLTARLSALDGKTHNAVDAACQKTRQDIAGQLAQLKQGADFRSTQAEADETMNNLEQSLRQLITSS